MVKVYLERRIRMSTEIFGGILLGISITILIFYLIRDIIISRLLNNLLEDSIKDEDIAKMDNIKYNTDILVDEFIGYFILLGLLTDISVITLVLYPLSPAF